MVATVDSSGIPRSILAAAEAFSDTNPFVRPWARYPDVSAELDETMPACEGMSTAFYNFVDHEQFESVEVIEASAPLEADADYHRWVRIRCDGLVVNVDWTARQFHNLEWIEELGDWNPEHADLPCPMIWLGDGPEHPVVDFTVQQKVALPAPAVEPEQPGLESGYSLGI